MGHLVNESKSSIFLLSQIYATMEFTLCKKSKHCLTMNNFDCNPINYRPAYRERLTEPMTWGVADRQTIRFVFGPENAS